MSQPTSLTTTDVGGEASGVVRPFRIDVPDEALTELRRRVEATVWPERETVADTSQGVPLEMMQDLARNDPRPASMLDQLNRGLHDPNCAVFDVTAK